MLSRRSLLGIAAAVSASSCYGNFSLTRKLYTWNGSFGSKFVSTILMWVLMIIPVYGIAGFVDLFIFNLIEFWTGSNPMAEVIHEDGSTTKFARLSPDTVRVTRVIEGKESTIELVMAGERALSVRAVDGTVLASGEALQDGSVALASEGKLRVISADDVKAAEQARQPSVYAARVLAGEQLASR